MKVISIIGPESTGKTTLSQSLADHYQAELVSEYARAYLTNLNRPYAEKDLLHIAKGQYESQQKSLLNSSKFTFWDTDLHVIRIWSKFKYGHCHPWIRRKARAQNVDLYLLTHYDIPYEEDPLRENPHDRKELFEIYKSYIKHNNLAFKVIEGVAASRLKYAINLINRL